MPALAACHAASQPARPPPTMWMTLSGMEWTSTLHAGGAEVARGRRVCLCWRSGRQGGESHGADCNRLGARIGLRPHSPPTGFGAAVGCDLYRPDRGNVRAPGLILPQVFHPDLGQCAIGDRGVVVASDGCLDAADDGHAGVELAHEALGPLRGRSTLLRRVPCRPAP